MYVHTQVLRTVWRVPYLSLLVPAPLGRTPAHPVSRNFLEESDSSMLYYNDSFYNDSGEVLSKGVIPNPKTPSVFKLKAYLGHY